MDEAKKQYDDAIASFHAICNKLIQESKTSMDQIIVDGNKSFDNMTKVFIEGSEKLRQKALSGNEAMMKCFSKNSQVLIKSIEDSYNELSKNNMGVFDNNLQKFQKQFDGMLDTYPVLKSSKFTEVMKELETNQRRALESANEKVKSAMNTMEDNFKVNLNALTVTPGQLQPNHGKPKPKHPNK